ncbi:MAG: hypothetical protein ACC651_17720, partial [Candidatus Scalindua sp.]
SGNFVEGLSTRDFIFTEDGKPVSALMENNQQTPKILILSDTSLSMPTEYREKGMMEFNESLKSNILKKYPSAVITFWETPSSLFTWLLKASQTGYDLIIFATDGDNVDVYDDKNFSVYRAGPPAIILNVKNSTWKTHTETFEKMANITNGLVINEKDQTKVLEEITKRIEAFEVPPYVFSYASADSSKKHTVRVSIDNNRINTTATYQFPETGIQSGNRIIGIYFEITVGRNQPIKRVLAGLDFKNEIYDLNKDYYLEIEGLLFGGALLAIEGEGPTLSMAISELLKSKLSNREWGEAFQDGDIKKTKEEIQKGILTYPAMLIPLMAPLQNQITNESLTFPAGYRMCLLKTRVGINKPTVFSFDYLPTSDYATIADDKLNSFTTTLLKTAQLSIRETELFQLSTYNLLQNSELIDRNSAYKEDWIRNQIAYENKDFKYWAEEVFRGDLTYKVFDKQAKSKAFWKINQYSGEMYGILPDGTGGGLYQYDSILRQLSTVLEGYALVIRNTTTKAILSGQAYFVSPLSIVVLFSITLVRKFAFATEAINIMDSQ